MIDAADGGEPRFVFKGGAAFELRFGNRARSTSDIDGIFRGNLDESVEFLERALSAGRSGFSGKLVRVVATATTAPCPSCGEFSTAVKSVREQQVRDVPHAGRRVMLTVAKRAFRCTAGGCERRTFTQYTNEIAARRRTTTRCRELIGRAGKERSTASVAREFSVSWATAWTAIRHVATRELGRCGRWVPAVIGRRNTVFGGASHGHRDR